MVTPLACELRGDYPTKIMNLYLDWHVEEAMLQAIFDVRAHDRTYNVHKLRMIRQQIIEL